LHPHIKFFSWYLRVFRVVTEEKCHQLYFYVHQLNFILVYKYKLTSAIFGRMKHLGSFLKQVLSYKFFSKKNLEVQMKCQLRYPYYSISNKNKLEFSCQHSYQKTRKNHTNYLMYCKLQFNLCVRGQ
jgi:hypothetical protein